MEIVAEITIEIEIVWCWIRNRLFFAAPHQHSSNAWKNFELSTDYTDMTD